MLKKTFAFLLAVLLLVAAFAVQAQDLPNLEGRTITVAVENAYQPFNFISEETGEAVGWDYDVINEICQRLNCTPEYIETSWDGMINAVSRGEFDVAADGITITVDRYEVVDFSIGYVRLAQRMMVRVDENRFSTVAEFVANPNLKIAVQTATTNFLTAQDLVGDARLIGLSEFGAAIQSLIAGDADAVLIDDVAGIGYVNQNKDKIKLLPEFLTSEALGFAFPKYSDLRRAFDLALKSMIADGTLDAINEKWGLPPYSPAQ